MTLEEVQSRVESIRSIARDDETAHAHEDQLHQELLQAIADGTCVDPVACAAAALETQKIVFARWCA